MEQRGKSNDLTDKLTGSRLFFFALGFLVLNGALMTFADWGAYGLLFVVLLYFSTPNGGRLWWQILIVWAISMLFVWVAQPAAVPIEVLYITFSLLATISLGAAAIERRRAAPRP